jgi:hypothetical protein
MADLYKRHFEEAAEEVKRLEESLNAVKEISGKQIINLREVYMYIHMYIRYKDEHKHIFECRYIRAYILILIDEDICVNVYPLMITSFIYSFKNLHIYRVYRL